MARAVSERCTLPYLAGLVAADGTLYQREVRVATGSLSHAIRLAAALRRLGYKPRIDRGVRVFLVRVYSVSLVRLLEEEYGIPLGRKAANIKFPSLRGATVNCFIAGFTDGDGSIGLIKSGVKEGRWGPYRTPRIVYASSSTYFLKGLQARLEVLGFRRGRLTREAGVSKLKYYGCDNLDRFMESIFPHLLNPVRIGGARAGANSCREVSC